VDVIEDPTGPVLQIEGEVQMEISGFHPFAAWVGDKISIGSLDHHILNMLIQQRKRGDMAVSWLF
jgi:hypothetical protein